MTADDDPDGLPDWARKILGDLARHPAAPDAQHVADWQQECTCQTCQLNWLVLAYMFTAMEPTDRALRPAEPREPAP